MYGFSGRKLPKGLVIQVFKMVIGGIEGFLMGQSEAFISKQYRIGSSEHKLFKILLNCKVCI